jgi:hypothetical protein
MKVDWEELKRTRFLARDVRKRSPALGSNDLDDTVSRWAKKIASRGRSSDGRRAAAT